MVNVLNSEKMQSLEIIPTLKYSVFENLVARQAKNDKTTPNAKHQRWRQFQCFNHESNLPFILEQYQKVGFCIFKDIFSQKRLQESRNSVNKIFRELIQCYDNVSDEFADFDQEGHAIVRMPRIGKGKHNIHFDPEFSEQHRVLSQMVSEAGILDLLSTVSGGTCTLRESGISLTRPNITLFGEISPGEGMEWHSDGAKGEFTMLLGLQDVEEVVGSLRIVPKSHLEYVEGIGHDENIIKSKLMELEQRKIDYYYRAGEPIIFDARTLHSVNSNHSDQWRMVLWFIMDCY